jgi:predicted O-methyltransferase YrrM
VRRAARWALVIAGRCAAAVRLLPPRIAFFYIAALLTAAARRDLWTLGAATRPADLAQLLGRAHGARSVAEIGSGPGWTALALALAEPARSVVSFDVDPRPVHTYARLAPRSARERVRFELCSGAEGASGAAPADFVFIDSSHRFDETIETFEAWRPRLMPGAVVVFHDYGNPQYPGVAEAVAALGLEGESDREIFVWRAP